MASKKNRNRKRPIEQVALAPSRDIPLSSLVLSPANVRHIFDADAIAALAESIAQRSLLQSLSVRPQVDATGAETGLYEVQGGGRRWRALTLLAEQGRVAADVPVPCVVKTTGLAEEDSLAENADREQLHPLDEYRAFAAMAAKGKREHEIAAAFRVTPAVVKQRLRLASASPVLLDAYVAEEIDLDDLMAYCITSDHERQEQVWAAVQARTVHADPWSIKRHLTQSTVPLRDRRVRFVGLDTYEQAGGTVLRDLFSENQDGYVEDLTLLNRLVDAKLAAARDVVLAKGWAWVTAAAEIPHTEKQHHRAVAALGPDLSEADQDKLTALQAELEQVDRTEPTDDDHADQLDGRRDDLEAQIAALENQPPRFDPEVMAKAGVFVSLNADGVLIYDCGYVRPGDETEPDAAEHPSSAAPADTDEEAETTVLRPIPDRLTQDLTSYRTVALRDALAQDYHVAFLAALHALCLNVFYRPASGSCLQLEAKTTFPAAAPGLDGWKPTVDIQERHGRWVLRLPKTAGELWVYLQGQPEDARRLLFAHCVSLTLNAVKEPHTFRREAVAHADALANALGLHMVAAGWTTTVDTYLGRVTKPHILAAVAEAKGPDAAELIAHLKKDQMATEAERLLMGTGWIPEALRTPLPADATPAEIEADVELPAFLAADAPQVTV